MPNYTFRNNDARVHTVAAPNEAVARTAAMLHWHGKPVPFGLAPESASYPIKPRPAAVSPKHWNGHGLTLLKVEAKN